jgi:hypothetical protein
VNNSHPDNVAAEPVFNPLSPDFLRDPYPTYHRLRLDDPMHRSPLGITMASRHADVAFILRDARFGKDLAGRIRRSSGDKALEEPAPAAACLSCAGLSLSLFALFAGQNTVWVWMALGASAAFWIIFGVILYFHHHPTLLPGSSC